MKLNKIIFSLCALSTSIVATSCKSDDDTAIIDLGAKTSITLERYYNDSGATTVATWGADQQGAIFVAGNGSAEVSYASPITPGSSKSLFMFQVQGARNAESTVVGFYPSTANVSGEGHTVKYNTPVLQTGVVSPLLLGYTTCRITGYEGVDLSLKQAYATLMVSVDRGNYSVKSVTVDGNGVNIAGNTTLDLQSGITSAESSSITVTPAVPVNCSGESQKIAVLLAPVELENGYTVKINTTDNKVLEYNFTEAVSLESGELYNTAQIVDADQKSIIFCGSNKVYMVNPDMAMGGTYHGGVTWEWNAEDIKDVLGLAANRCNHIDDAKPLDNGSKLLITSSYNWTVLLDVATKQPLFFATNTPGAHSAEMLPGNKVVVACSDNGDKLQIYDISKNNEILFSTPLTSAHGVVYIPSTDRLYAIGGQALNIYKLVGMDTNKPSLELETSVKTPKAGLHDMYLVDSNTLTIAGRGCYLYDIANNSFKEMTQFSASTALKSVNYNGETGACWYTDATTPEGTQTWSTQTLHYSTNVMGASDAGTIKVPDMDVYKVRVLKW